MRALSCSHHRFARTVFRAGIDILSYCGVLEKMVKAGVDKLSAKAITVEAPKLAAKVEKALNTLIAAARDPGMTGAIVYDVEQTCWRHGWDIYNYFAVEGPVSRYGCWGAAEDWKDINPGSPKLQAIYNITGHEPDALATWATDPHRERAQETR